MNKKVNIERMKAWVEALRSGDYKQGTEYLRYAPVDGEDKWCCLGVLCDLAAKDGVGEWTIDKHDPRTAGVPNFADDEYSFLMDGGDEPHTQFPPVEIMHDYLGYDSKSMNCAWAGDANLDVMSDGNGDCDHETGVAMNVVGLNDDGVTFERIADLIESTFLGDSE